MSYVDIKKLIATADSSSIDRENESYAGGPQNHDENGDQGSPKFYDIH